jgi:diaminopropionate ammonia-lyase
VKHLGDGSQCNRPYILLNKHRVGRQWNYRIDPAIEIFHQTLPHYGETKLHSLPEVAKQLG